MPNPLISIQSENELQIAFDALSACSIVVTSEDAVVRERVIPSQQTLAHSPVSCWFDLSTPIIDAVTSSSSDQREKALENASRVSQSFQDYMFGNLPAQSVQLSLNLGEFSLLTNRRVHVELRRFSSELPSDICLRISLGGQDSMGDWAGPVRDFIEELGRPAQTILVHYADAEKVLAPTWDEVFEVSRAVGGKYIWVDLWEQNKLSILDVIDHTTLKHMVAHSHAHGLEVAFAGPFSPREWLALSEIAPHWIGYRGEIDERPIRDLPLAKFLDAFQGIQSEVKACDRHVIRK